MSSTKLAVASPVKLNNGVEMPRIHLGVYCTKGQETINAVAYALEAGYRAIDSAEWYGNEAEVGSAINAYIESSGTKRSDLWFTTKLKTNMGYDDTRRKIKGSIKRSGLGYIDLYLLHSPIGGPQKRKECWRAVEDAIEDGEVRVGGVSNFGVRHLKELLDSKPKIIPAINQIELHPFNTQLAISSFCQEHGIQIEAYGPLARAMRFRNPTIVKLAKKYNVSSAQLMVRWSLQMGYVPLPKSTGRERIVSNRDVGGFEIEEEDVEVMLGLHEGLVTDWDPTDVD